MQIDNITKITTASIGAIGLMVICSARVLAQTAMYSGRLTSGPLEARTASVSEFPSASSRMRPLTGSTDFTFNCEQAKIFAGTNEDWTFGTSSYNNVKSIASAKVTLNTSGNGAPTILSEFTGAGGPYAKWRTEVVFDTTQFQFNDEITLTFTVKLVNGSTGTCNTTAPVDNRAFLMRDTNAIDGFNFRYGDTLINNVENELETNAGYHVVTVESGNSWTGAQVADALRYYNTFLEFSHGNEGYFEAPNGDYLMFGPPSTYDFPGSGAYNPSSVLDAVNEKTDMDPQYEFVNADSCWSTGRIDTFGMKTENNSGSGAFNTTGADQAFLGWSVEASTSSANVDFVNAIWNDLATGYTLEGATGLALSVSIPRDAGLFPYFWQVAGPTRLGDLYTKIHGVYCDAAGEVTQPSGSSSNMIEPNTDTWRVVYKQGQ